MNAKELKSSIVRSLNIQGFFVNGHVEPLQRDKESFRAIQSFSRREQLKLQRTFIENSYNVVRKYAVNGRDINPARIDLELRSVENNEELQTIFKWWNLTWWSVPYQKAYGRQMRFIIWDKEHNAPFGLIGLQSPVLKMSVRDKYLEIPNEELDIWINKSMQAQRLGALPPYNQLLGGKMVAMALTASELRRAYKKKYKDVETLMERRIIEPDLLFITTTSAFGKSSIYNRLKYNDELVAESLGYTKGSGTFHISEEIYREIQKYLIRRGVDVSTSFGSGPSRKVKLLDTAFASMNLPNYSYHNIQREFFIFPLAKNLKNVIKKDVRPRYFNRKLIDLTDFWKERWAIPRSERMPEWRQFDGTNCIDELKNSALVGIL